MGETPALGHLNMLYHSWVWHSVCFLCKWKENRMAVIKAIPWSHLDLSKTNWSSPWGSYDPRRHYESPETVCCQALPSWCHQCWFCQVWCILLQWRRLWPPTPMKWCIMTTHPPWGVSRRSYLGQMLIAWARSAWSTWMGEDTIWRLWIHTLDSAWHFVRY